ncbi:MAG: hypothetical protein Tsb005_16710 [Gammaproteobacteria bacterium]
MKINLLEGDWQDLKKQLQHTWQELTEVDLKKIESDRKELFNILKKQYGYAENEVEKKLETLMKNKSTNKNSDNSNEKSDTSNQGLQSTMKECMSAMATQSKEHPIRTFGLIAAAGFLLGLCMSRK